MATPSLKLEPTVCGDFHVLGVRVDAVQIVDVVRQMAEWIDGCGEGPGARRVIAVTGMHGVTEAQHHAEFHRVLDEADLVVADGMPLVWLGRLRGFAMRRRVYGPELLETFCEQTATKEYRHFFYGGAEGVADELASRLAHRFPGMQIAGTFCPPFRALTTEEEREACAKIIAARADVLWVGLSTPKQERWMANHRDLLGVPVMVGVGAAFDFHTGRVAQAPGWMREHGLEWLFRLASEPRRLWRRYLISGSEFVWLVLLELTGLKKF